MNPVIRDFLILFAFAALLVGTRALTNAIIMRKVPRCPSCGEKMTVDKEDDDLVLRHRKHWTCSCGRGGAIDFTRK